YIPISALHGDNIVTPSVKMPWYTGQPLLQYLEEVELSEDINLTDPRFQVQYVIRPQTTELHDYRGYAGQIVSGIYKKGDKITVRTAGMETTPSKIEIAGQEVEEALAAQAAVLHHEDDIDIRRGDSFVRSDNQPKVGNEIEVLLCWLDNKPLLQGN